MITPYHYARIWRGLDKKIIGQILTLPEYQTDLKLGATLWSFTGRRATVCIVTFENDVYRETALDFAIMFMKGTYVTITVDLANLPSTTTNGSPPP